MSKKFLAKLLIFCMVFTMMPFSTFAADEPTAQADNVYTVNWDTNNSTTITAGEENGVTLAVKDIVYNNASDTEMTGYTFAWSSNNSNVTVTGEGKTAKVVADAQAAGTATITVTVSKDGGQGTTTTMLTVESAPAEKVNITFNAGEGATVSPASIEIEKGAPVGELPTPTRTGYTFNGWFTAATGGTKVTAATTFDEDTVIYAQWTEATPVDNSYKVTIDTKVDLYVADTATLEATVKHNDVTLPDQTVIWSSSDPTVATVDANGVVTALKVGTTTITATYTADSKSYEGTINITVQAREYKVAISVEKLDIFLGDIPDVKATVTDADGKEYTDVGFTWTSSDSSVVSVADGKMEGKAVGTAGITVKATRNGVEIGEATITVNVQEQTEQATITGVTVSPIATTLVLGGDKATAQLTATVSGIGAFDKTVSWSNSDRTVATVDATGLVTAVKEGTAKITATANGNPNMKGESTITVAPAGTAVYTVTFDTDGGSLVNEQTVKAGDKAEMPNQPTKAGYDFAGWYAEGATEPFDFNTPINDNITLTAKWTEKVVDPEEYTIEPAETPVNGTFDYSPKTAAAGTKVTITVNPDNGYKLGEIIVMAGEEKVEVAADGTFTMPAANVKITVTFVEDKGETPEPKDVTVKFDANGGVGNVADITAKVGDTITLPAAGVTRDGYKFLGWAESKDAAAALENSYVVPAPAEGETIVTLYAVWIQDFVTVTFDANGGTLSETKISLLKGASLTEDVLTALLPEREGYNFIGWYDAKEGGNQITIDTVFNADSTVYAQWAELVVEIAKPDTKVVVSDNIPAVEQEAAKAAGEAVANFTGSIVSDNTLSQTVIAAVTAGKEEGSLVIKGAKGNVDISVDEQNKAGEALKQLPGLENATPKTFVIPTIAVTLKSSGAAYETRVTFDIQPQAVVVVADESLNPKDTKFDATNSVEIKKVDIEITTPVTVTLPLADDFFNKVAKAALPIVRHTKDNGVKHNHLVRVNHEAKAVSFINRFGFSEMVVDVSDNIAALIGNDAYDTLQEAVTAVADGQTIKVYKAGEAEVNEAKSFTLEKAVDTDITVTVTAAAGYKLDTKPADTAKGFGLYKAVKDESYNPGTSGGGGSSSNVSIATKVTGGKVTVTPTRPTRGQTVTITVTPADGYKLDTLTVTDLKGNTIELTKVSDTKYTFVMPAGKVKVNPSFVKIDGSDKKEEQPGGNVSKRFSDVDSSAWYAEYINYVAENGLMNGYENGTFGPNDKTTRAQIVTVLYRMEGEPAAPASSSFKDVSAGGQYYSSAVTWAARNNIVNGYEDGRFGPNDNVTREQIAAILFRYAEYKGYDTSLTGNVASFSDAAKVSSWANKAIGWAIGEGLMNGDNGALRPQGNATRAEIAALLMRFSENIAK